MPNPRRPYEPELTDETLRPHPPGAGRVASGGHGIVIAGGAGCPTTVGNVTLADEHYATLAETWLGVPAGDLLPGSPNLSGRKPILLLRLA